MSLIRRRMPFLFAALVFLGAACSAPGEDHGVWDSVECGDRPEACMWKGTPDSSSMLSSNVRDSKFSNDDWTTGSGNSINDEVRYIQNTFGDITVKGFREYNYITAPGQNPTSCVPHGQTYGPYTQTSPDGISSFRKC